MIDWLRRLICRCPDTIENTGYTGTHTGLQFTTFDVPTDLMPFVQPAGDDAVRQALKAEAPSHPPELPTDVRGRHLRLVGPDDKPR